MKKSILSIGGLSIPPDRWKVYWLESPKRQRSRTIALLEEKTATPTVEYTLSQSLTEYNGRRVAVTGTFNPCTEVLTLESGENITRLE